jgi:hypothetical protein
MATTMNPTRPGSTALEKSLNNWVEDKMFNVP